MFSFVFWLNNVSRPSLTATRRRRRQNVNWWWRMMGLSISLVLRVCGWYVLKQSEKKIVFFFFFFFPFFWKAVLGPPTGLAACCLPPAKSSSRSSSSSSSSYIRAFRRSWAVWVCTPGPPHPPLAAPFASKEREEPFAMCQIHIYDWLIFSLQVIASDDTRGLNYHTWSLILSTVGEND